MSRGSRCAASVAAASGTGAGSISRCGRDTCTVHHWAVMRRLSGHQRGVASASGSLTGTGIWLMWVSAGRGVMVAGSGVGSDGPVGNDLVPSSSGEVLGRIPVGLRVAAAIGWRLVVVLITVAALAWVISRMQFIVIPVAVAVLLAALLAPAVRLRRGSAGCPVAWLPQWSWSVDLLSWVGCSMGWWWPSSPGSRLFRPNWGRASPRSGTGGHAVHCTLRCCS